MTSTDGVVYHARSGPKNMPVLPGTSELASQFQAAEVEQALESRLSSDDEPLILMQPSWQPRIAPAERRLSDLDEKA